MLDKNSRIYVAGHTGLIGSAFVRILSAAGYNNLIMRSHEQLELCDSHAVNQFFESERPEFVILAAGKVGGIHQNQVTPATFMTANLSIQLNVMQAAQCTGARALVMFGSSCMYPKICEQPMDVSKLLSGHPEPTSLSYAVSKLAGVQLCQAFNKEYGSTLFLPVIPNSAYGPHDDFNPKTGHVLSALIARMYQAQTDGSDSVTLWGTGTPRREFIYSDDIAEAVLYLLSNRNALPDGPVNIGSGVDYSISELAEAIAKTVGFAGTINWDIERPDGTPQKLLDCGLLRGMGWEPKVDLIAGLSKAFQWYKKNSAGLND